MGQTCCSQKNVDNSQTLTKDDNKTQPDLERLNSKQDSTPLVDDTTKNGKGKEIAKQESIQQSKRNHNTQENENERDESNESVNNNKSKRKDDQVKVRGSQLEQDNIKEGNYNSSDTKKTVHTSPAGAGIDKDDWDNQSKKKQADYNQSGVNQQTDSNQKQELDLFLDLPGPPNLRDIHSKKSSLKPQVEE